MKVLSTERCNYILCLFREQQFSTVDKFEFTEFNESLVSYWQSRLRLESRRTMQNSEKVLRNVLKFVHYHSLR
jgi:hypothetical protein